MGPRILLIEDDAATMQLMLCLLKAFGFTTALAFNAEDGFRLAKSIKPDLILCDVNMPGTSGAAFVRGIKQVEELREIPVLAVTAMAMEGDKEGLIALGFDGYIPKPIAPETLHAQLSEFVNT